MLNKIKKNLGAGCDYLSFSTDKVRNEDGSWTTVSCIKAVLKNDFGKKDTINIALDKLPVDLVEDDYQKIFYILNSRCYDDEIKTETED